MSADNTVLVFDCSLEGHRPSYVKALSALLTGKGAIGPIKSHLRALLLSPNLLLTTFETAPKAYAAIMIVRALLFRRTGAIFLRAHIASAASAKAIILKMLARLPGTTLFSVVPIQGSNADSFITITDPAFWDLSDAELSPPVTGISRRVLDCAAGRQILLFAGYVEASRGIDFLADLVRSEPTLVEHLAIVIVGTALADASDAVAELEEGGAMIELRFVDDDELLSLFAAATLVWCCFPPERDMSSGVFGRALQFGALPVIRRGSILDRNAGSTDAIRLDYAAADQASLLIAAAQTRPKLPDASTARWREATRAVLLMAFRV